MCINAAWNKQKCLFNYTVSLRGHDEWEGELELVSNLWYTDVVVQVILQNRMAV